jgi:hypothetical protein
MQKLERTMDVVQRVRGAIEELNTDGSLAARVPRSSRSTTAATLVADHGAHRAAQSGLRHRADLPDPVGVPRDLRCAPDRVGDDPVALLLA